MTIFPTFALRREPAPPRASSILGLGFPTCLERHWFWLIRFDIPKQGGDPDTQYICKGFKGGDRHVFRAALDPTKIGAVNAGLQRQPFLRKALGDPKATKVPADGAARVHDWHMSHIGCLTIDGLSVPYCNYDTNRKQIRMNAYIGAMCRYFEFKGRASRSEFWYFMLVAFGGSVIAMAIDLALGNDEKGVMLFTALWVIPHYIPSLAVSVRRLHDIDRSGWWVLIGVIPLGAIVLLVFHCQPSTPGANRFGSGPVGKGAQAPVPAHQQTNTGAGTPSLDQIERLAALRASGAISETEFRQMKAEAMAGGRA